MTDGSLLTGREAIIPLSADELRRVRELIVSNEGWRNVSYPDSLAIPTVGVGFNLDRPDARQRIEALGLDYQRVRDGSQALTDVQVDALFTADLNQAVSTVESLVSAGLSEGRRAVLIDMAFNLGSAGLGGFVNMLDAVNQGDWPRAAQEMANSRWANQVGGRATRNISAMTNGSLPARGGGGTKPKDAEKQKDSDKGKDGDKGKEGKERQDKGKEGKDNKDSKEGKDRKEGKDDKDQSDKGKDSKEGKDRSDKGKDSKEGKEGKDRSDKGKDSKEGKDGKDRTDKGKDSKEGKDGKDRTDKGKDSKDGKDSSDKGKDRTDKGKDSKEGKDRTDKGKDSKDSKDSIDRP